MRLTTIQELRVTIRVLLSALLVALILLTSNACTSKIFKHEKPPIKISINQWPGYAYAFIAEKKGFFANNGVKVELVYNNEQIDSLNMFKNGKVDGAFMVLADLLPLNSIGVPSRAVSIIDESIDADVIIGRPEFNSLADLKDKTVSFEGVNTFSHIFVISAIQKAGLKESDLKFANVPAHSFLRELESGKIDAGHTWESTKSKALEKGYRILFKAGDIPDIIIDVLAFDIDVIKERPADVKAIVKSLFEAFDYSKKNPDEALKITAAAEDMSIEEMRAGLAGIHQFNMKENLALMTSGSAELAMSFDMAQNFYLSRGQMVKIMKLENLFDASFITELNK